MSEKLPTREEITKRFKEKYEKDAIGLWYEFNGKILVPYLSFEYLRTEWARKEITDKQIKDIMEELIKEKILKEAIDYLSFAWDKCNNERGISANRSIEHYIEWFWLMGETDFSTKIQNEFNENYNNYGFSILKMIETKLKEMNK